MNAKRIEREIHPATSVRIRAARPSDAPALARLSHQLGYEATPSEIAERLALLPAVDEVLVAEVNEGADAPDDGAMNPTSEVVGWIHLTVHRSLYEPVAFIFGLVVEDAWRGQGIGARLLSAADDYASRRGLRTLSVRSNVIRERAHAFYRRNGFVEVKRQVALQRPVSTPPKE